MERVNAGTAPPFPGGIGVTHLRVYDTAAPDGLAGGTPHLHTVCTEAYVVIGGAGAVHTLTAAGFTETRLEPGAFVWFTPGTIHRLVNDGELEILVLMGNAGLPEAGDMVITFPPDVVTDARAYDAAASLPAERERRELAVPAFLDLVAATTTGDPAPLRAFHAAAGALVQPRLDEWAAIWRTGPAAAAEATRSQLAALAAGRVDHLADASVHVIAPPAAQRRPGCCGTLGTYVVR